MNIVKIIAVVLGMTFLLFGYFIYFKKSIILSTVSRQIMKQDAKMSSLPSGLDL